MSINPRFVPERPISEISRSDETPGSTMLCKGAFVQRLPLALSYAANLEPQDHAVLFYDNLVVAAEYFCAFIEEGIKRHEVTCFTGLEPTRYRRLFEQVGISVAELETCGYLRNISSDNFQKEIDKLNGNERNSDDPFRIGLDDDPKGIRFIHVQNPHVQQKNSPEALLENERPMHRLFSFPTTSICCYEADLVLEEAPSEFFNELLKTHNHCLFQGMAMPTSRLLDLPRSPVYPKLKFT